MPHLACWSCGRQIYATSPLESLYADERRCPRCGAQMNLERREKERRQNSPGDPGPPSASGERRTSARRSGSRRQGR